MSPVGLPRRDLSNHRLQNRWEKEASMTDLHHEKTDFLHRSSRDNSHGFGGFGGFSGFSGSGSNRSGGFSFSKGGNNNNNGFNFSDGNSKNSGNSLSDGSGINSNNGGHGGGGDNGGNSNNSDTGSNNTGNNSDNINSGSNGHNPTGGDGGAVTQVQTVTTTFSVSASVSPSSLPTSSQQDNVVPTTTLITSSPSSELPAPTSTSTGLPPTAERAIHHVSLPLGSIVAIILGILFCITISGVIYIFVRPKLSNLGRQRKHSRVASPYLPSITSYEPKEIRDSSNLYRPYQPQDLSTFPFGSQTHLAAYQGYNGASAGGFDNLQTQIYSTSLPGTSSPRAERSLTSLHSYKSEEDDSLESLNRIMSMMDRYPFERNSAVDSGQISPNLSDKLSLDDDHADHLPGYPRSVGPETTTGE